MTIPFDIGCNKCNALQHGKNRAGRSEILFTTEARVTNELDAINLEFVARGGLPNIVAAMADRARRMSRRDSVTPDRIVLLSQDSPEVESAEC